MELIYCRGAQPNFGDDLNAILWPRLLPGLFDTAGADGFLGIGTLVGMAVPACSMLHVFSSGAGYDALDNWRIPRRVWCVRGPLTAHLLGLGPDSALTDGAILAPDLLGHAAGDPTGRAVAVVPHWQSLAFPGWQAACDQAGFRLVTPVDTPERVHSAIGTASLVLTESLHGAILADAMDIPWIAFVTTRNVSALKWVDWSLSVGQSFAPVPLPPPSAAAAMAFGRPRPGPARVIDAEAALAEFSSRTAASDDRARRQPWANRLRAAARGAARVSGLIDRPWVNGALGYGPERTASQLVQAAQTRPRLSRASLRAELRSAMLERLHRFERTQLPAVPAAEPAR